MTLRACFPAGTPRRSATGCASRSAGRRTIERKFLDAYAAEKRALLERAEPVENLLNQTESRFRRLDLGSFRGLVYAILNPGRPLPASGRRTFPPAGGLAFHLRRDRVEPPSGSARSPTTCFSVREVPAETWAGMLPLEALLEGTFVFNIEVCPADQVRKFLAAKKRLAFCQMSGGDDKVDVSAMKTEVDQVTAEIFTEGARVYSARTHVITPAPADGRHQRVLRASASSSSPRRAYADPCSSSRCPWPTIATNDRTLKRGRRMLGLNLSTCSPCTADFRARRRPISFS
jgi:hypothetical protein